MTLRQKMTSNAASERVTLEQVELPVLDRACRTCGADARQPCLRAEAALEVAAQRVERHARDAAPSCRRPPRRPPAPWSTGRSASMPHARLSRRLRQRLAQRHRQRAPAPRRSSTPRSRRRSAPPLATQRRHAPSCVRNSKCCGSRKKLVWLVAIASSSSVSSAPARVALDVLEILAEAREPAGCRRRFCRRASDERLLALVQRDAGSLVDEPDDRADSSRVRRAPDVRVAVPAVGAQPIDESYASRTRARPSAPSTRSRSSRILTVPFDLGEALHVVGVDAVAERPASARSRRRRCSAPRTRGRR